MKKIYAIFIFMLTFQSCLSVLQHSTSFSAAFPTDFEEPSGYSVTQTVYYK